MMNQQRPLGTEFRARTVASIFFTGLSIALFFASLTQDGFYIDRKESPRAWANCFGLLMIGWILVLEGVLAWLANPTLAAAWIFACFQRFRFVALGCAIVSLGFALSFLLVDEILTDEGGGTSKITGYGPGYWLWIASISTALIGSLIGVALDQLVPRNHATSQPQ